MKQAFFRIFPLWKHKKKSYSDLKLRFLMQREEIFEACEKIAPLFGQSARALHGLYMTEALKRDDAWFEEHSGENAQGWFVFEFLSENHLAQTVLKSEPDYFVVRPENVKAYLFLSEERDFVFSERGAVYIRYFPMTREFAKVARDGRFTFENGIYKKTVDKGDAPLTDRAVEAGVYFLKKGYGIYTGSSQLARRIETEDFSPLPPFRIYAGEENEVLIVRFPYDRELFGHFVRNGGRWTGKALEFPVASFDAVSDIVRMCRFQIDKESQMRIDAWRKVEKEAKVYAERHRKVRECENKVGELFEAFLKREKEDISDLYESDVE